MNKNLNANIIFICIASVLIFLIVLATSSSKEDQDTKGQENTTAEVTPVTTPSTSTPITPSTTPPKSGGTTTNTASGYTLAEVATHKDGKSCWTVVNGNVYDVTKWISQHPGGSRTILSMCGIDASSAYDGQHGGERRPEQELASFKIGALKK